MKALPIYRGRTVDERLGEFRKVEFKHGLPHMKTAPFSTLKGQMILRSYTYHKLGRK